MLGFLEGLPIQYYTPSRRPSWYREHCSHWVMEFIIRDHWNQGSTYQNQLVLEPCRTKTFSNPSTAQHQRIFEPKKSEKYRTSSHRPVRANNEIKTRSLRTVTRNSEIRDGEDDDVLRRPACVLILGILQTSSLTPDYGGLIWNGSKSIWCFLIFVWT